MNNKYVLLGILALIMSVNLISLNSAFPILVLNSSQTLTLGGNYTYDYVLVKQNATIYVNSSIGYLNITAIYNFTNYGTIDATPSSTAPLTQLLNCKGGNGDTGGTNSTYSYYFSGGGGGGGYGSGGNAGVYVPYTPKAFGGYNYSNVSSLTNFVLCAGGFGGSPGSGGSVQYGNGGGTIKILSPLIISNGSFLANGSSLTSGDYAGGGGGGGTILIEGINLILTNSVFSVSGGNGGGTTSSPFVTYGGGGGGGLVKIFYAQSIQNNTITILSKGGNGGGTDGYNTGGSGNNGSSNVSKIALSAFESNWLPSVNLLLPYNGSYSPSQNVFLVTSIDQINLANATLYIWNATSGAIWNKSVTTTISSQLILSPNEIKSGNTIATNLSGEYDELVNAGYNPTMNVTQVIGNKLWIPWYSSSTSCGVSDLHHADSCSLATSNMTDNCMVSDEFSQVGVGLSMGINETRFDQFYNTILSINSSYGQLPSWIIIRNASQIKSMDTNTASDADARIISALYSASNNLQFSQTNRTKYLNLANNLSRDFVTYDLVFHSYQSSLGYGNISYWLASGAVQAASGLSSSNFGYSGYYPDAIIAMEKAYLVTSDSTYLSIAKNITLNYLEASKFNGISFTVPPMGFSWGNLTGIPNTTCTSTCSPVQWDSQDAPRAFGLGQAELYANQNGITLPLLTSYMNLWRSNYMGQFDSLPLQYYPNGTASAANQSSYFAQGLQSSGLIGNYVSGLSLFNNSLRSALSHYQSGSGSMDSTACFGVYQEAPVIRSLGIAIGRDSPYTTSSTNSWNVTFNASGTFLWNVLVFNNGSYSNWATNNNTLYVDISNPVIQQIFPVDVSYFNYHNINLDCNFQGDNLNAGFLYGNFSSTYALNQTNLSIVQNVNTFFNLNLPDRSYSYTCAANKTTGSTKYYSQYGNYTFTIDTVNPVMNDMTITTTANSNQISFLTNITDLNMGTCVYSIWTGSTPGTNTPFTCNSATSANAPGFGTYTLFVYTTDLAGNTNSQNLSFTTSISSGGTIGGGGGVTINNGQSSWTMSTDSNTASYVLSMSPGTQRSKNIVFYNKGTTSINLNLKATGNASSYVLFDSDTLTLPVLADIPTQTGFTVTVPKGTPYGTYQTNLIATDQNGNNGLVTVIIDVGSLGTFAKLGLSLQVADNIFIPYLIISLFTALIVGAITYFISKKVAPDLAMSIAIFAGLIGFFAILFIV